MTSIIFIGGGGGGLPATITKLQNFSYSGVLNPGPTTLNLNVPDAGDEDDTRRIFVVAVGTGVGTITSLTILGVTATSHTTTFTNIRIFSALVPTGTNGDVVFNFSTTALKNFTAWVLGTTNIQNATPTDVSTNFTPTGPTAYDLTPDVIEGGVLIGAVLSVTTLAISIAGIDTWETSSHDSDDDLAMWEACDVTQTPQTITITQTGAFADSAAVVLAFR